MRLIFGHNGGQRNARDSTGPYFLKIYVDFIVRQTRLQQPRHTFAVPDLEMP
jgi:hypothetical protein